MLSLRPHHRTLDQPLLVKNRAHLLFADAQRGEPRKHVADASRSPIVVFAFQGDDLLASGTRGLVLDPVLSAFRDQPGRTAFAKRLGPLLHRGARDSERLRRVRHGRTL